MRIFCSWMRLFYTGSQWDSVSLSNVLRSEFLVLVLCYRIRARGQPTYLIHSSVCSLNRKKLSRNNQLSVYKSKFHQVKGFISLVYQINESFMKRGISGNWGIFLFVEWREDRLDMLGMCWQIFAKFVHFMF